MSSFVSSWTRRRAKRTATDESSSFSFFSPGARIGNKGYFVQPTVFSGVTNEMVIGREEIFGPVACVLKFSTEAEAIAIANDTSYGLAAGIHSTDASQLPRVSRKLKAGTGESTLSRSIPLVSRGLSSSLLGLLTDSLRSFVFSPSLVELLFSTASLGSFRRIQVEWLGTRAGNEWARGLPNYQGELIRIQSDEEDERFREPN